MTSRYWVKLFFTTLLVGGLTTGLVGFIVRWEEFEPFFTHFNIIEILSVFAWLIGVGLIFSIISQMGFFAYLTVHRFGMGIFRSFWNAVQVVIILFVIFDLVYFRYSAFADKGDSIWPYIGLALIVVVSGLAVAYLKMKQTNKHAFIPALFFMVVVTVIEWVPVLRVNEHSWLYLMVFPLLVCNAYQVLMLHKYNAQAQKERQNKKQELNKSNKVNKPKKKSRATN